MNKVVSLEERSPILFSPPVKSAAGPTMGAETADAEMEKKHNYWISFLCVMFGIGTWLPVNAVYSQLPIFVQLAPEGWNLPSYMSLLVQCANIAPLLWYLFHNKFVEKQSIIICAFLILGTFSVFSLAFTYDIQFSIFDAPHSGFFFIFTFFVSLMGCVSSVLFLPFMNQLPELYLVPYFIGEGLSGLIPGIVALIQGVGQESNCAKNVTTKDDVNIGPSVTAMHKGPLFGSSFFLIIIGLFMIMSTASFFYLNYISSFIRDPRKNRSSAECQQNRSDGESNVTSNTISRTLFIALLSAQTLINCFSNGILPGIQSYSCLPYGAEAYHWSVNLNQIISPVVIYFAFFLPVISLRLLTICGLFEMVCLIYELFTAFLSPTPPLVHTIIGAILIVFTWMLGAGMISYMKLSIAAIFRRKHHKGLINYGLVTQIGSAAGSVISFVLVNYLQLFHSAPQATC